jgi:hypothetical protein
LLEKHDILKIDKDCIVPHTWLQEYFYKVILPVCNLNGISVQWMKYCLSPRKGLHFYIKVIPAVDATLALKLQFLMGDDAQRVSKNRARIRIGLPNWNKLFLGKKPAKLHTLYRTIPESKITRTTNLHDLR